jgi:hypothetical protein
MAWVWTSNPQHREDRVLSAPRKNTPYSRARCVSFCSYLETNYLTFQIAAKSFLKFCPVARRRSISPMIAARPSLAR